MGLPLFVCFLSQYCSCPLRLGNNIKCADSFSASHRNFTFGADRARLLSLAATAHDIGGIASTLGLRLSKVIGTTTIRESITSKKDQSEMQKLMAAAQAKKIDAVFVFSSKHISEDYDVSGAFMDALNKCDVVVYDNEGYE